MTFETKDQYIASVLFYFQPEFYTGYRVDTAGKGRRIYYIFDNPTEQSEEIVRQYYAGKLQVEPYGFVQCVTKVKDIFKSLV